MIFARLLDRFRSAAHTVAPTASPAAAPTDAHAAAPTAAATAPPTAVPAAGAIVAPAAGATDAERVAARERAIAERLLEDEAARGDLDDATWQPIQDWLLKATGRLAASTRGLDDAAAQPALDSGESALRAAARTLVEALSGGDGADLESLAGSLPAPIMGGTHAAAAAAALRAAVVELAHAPADPPAAARRLVAALDARAVRPTPRSDQR